jgi:hypothetical protein
MNVIYKKKKKKKKMKKDFSASILYGLFNTCIKFSKLNLKKIVFL